MKRIILFATLVFAAITAAEADAQAPAANHDPGFKDTPVLPGLPWHVHDPNRPHPPVVAPAAAAGGAPSDVIVLDGQVAAIYGQWPPLANPGRRLGEWNAYGIVFEAPRMDGDINC